MVGQVEELGAELKTVALGDGEQLVDPDVELGRSGGAHLQPLGLAGAERNHLLPFAKVERCWQHGRQLRHVDFTMHVDCRVGPIRQRPRLARLPGRQCAATVQGYLDDFVDQADLASFPLLTAIAGMTSDLGSQTPQPVLTQPAWRVKLKVLDHDLVDDSDIASLKVSA